MRFLIDANLPRSAAAMLTELGFLADHVLDLGLGAALDSEIANLASSSNATLITRDLDFSDVRRYPPQLYAGLIVLRIPDDMIANDIVALLRRVLIDKSFIANLKGHLIIVESNRVRFRPGLV